MLKLALIFFVSISAILSYPDMDVRGNFTENFFGLQGRVNLKLTSMSYKQNEPVYLDFTVKNYGNEVIRIFPTTENLQTYQFIITDENDEILQARETLKAEILKSSKIKMNNLVGDNVKEIIIHKNESFTKRFNLNEYFEFEPGKKYYVTGYFYPNYTEDKNTFAKSENQTIFQVEKKKEERLYKRYNESELAVDGLSPEETIYLFLGAELKKNWNHYYKYIYFPEFILGYTKFANEYTSAESGYKEIVVDEFKKYLTESRSGKITYYKITSTEEINPVMSKVYVHVERELNRIPSRFEYQYTLKKLDDTRKGFWKISGVVVKVKK
ncbi:MAG: hypothetical protein KBA66_21255 [Leptospiraceae bacterium]|nr:hypothetical protein [Leptospiraceae bacterium]